MGRALPLLILLALVACAAPAEIEYAEYDRRMREIGRHRVDPAPLDAPFGAAELERNFVTVALNVEAMPRQRARAQPVRKWRVPIVYALIGAGVTPADRLRVEAYFSRLARLTGLTIREGSDGINMPILFIGEAERARELARARASTEPGMAFFADFLSRPDRENPCRGTLRHNRNFEIVFAAVLIKNEVSGTLRRACIEEELSQSLGLTNDSPEVRPSIFNDDQEFAALTRHDEYLLRILYDPRIRAGMREDEVRALLPDVVADAWGDGR